MLTTVEPWRRGIGSLVTGKKKKKRVHHTPSVMDHGGKLPIIIGHYSSFEEVITSVHLKCFKDGLPLEHGAKRCEQWPRA